MDIAELLEKVERLEKDTKRLDKLTHKLSTQTELYRALLIKLVNSQNFSSDLLVDIDYLMIERELFGQARYNVGEFVTSLLLENKYENKVFSEEEFHVLLLKALDIPSEEFEKYPLAITKRFLQEREPDSMLTKVIQNDK